MLRTLVYPRVTDDLIKANLNSYVGLKDTRQGGSKIPKATKKREQIPTVDLEGNEEGYCSTLGRGVWRLLMGVVLE